MDRLIVVANNRIVMDGSKNEVIARLKGAQGASNAASVKATPPEAHTTHPVRPVIVANQTRGTQASGNATTTV